MSKNLQAIPVSATSNRLMWQPGDAFLLKSDGTVFTTLSGSPFLVSEQFIGSQIQRATDDAFTQNVTTIPINTTALVFTDATAVRGVQYFYRVRSKMPSGAYSPNWSNTISITAGNVVLLLPSTNCELYLEAEKEDYVNAATAPQATDYSDNSRNLTSVPNPPVFIKNAVNGKAVYRFDGTSSPLKNADKFTVGCGFVVVKINEAAFTDYSGILTDLTSLGILVGDTGTANIFDFPVSQELLFEFRANDRIYKHDDMPAPMNVWRVIFFRFWQSVVVDGIQIGQDRNFGARKAKMDLALVALYSGGFCEADIRKHSLTLAYNFGLTLADVVPYQGMKGDEMNGGRVAYVYDPPEGERIVEVLGEYKQTYNLTFASRSNNEFKKMREYYKSHYPGTLTAYRDCNILPPEDIEGYIDSPMKRSGATNNINYSFAFKEK